MLFFLLLWPQSGKTQVLTPQWTDPFSVPLERLGQGMGKDKEYVRPADPPIISRVKENEENNARRLLQQIDAGADINAGTSDGKRASGRTALSRARDRPLWNVGGRQHVEVVAILTQAGTSQLAVRPGLAYCYSRLSISISRSSCPIDAASSSW